MRSKAHIRTKTGGITDATVSPLRRLLVLPEITWTATHAACTAGACLTRFYDEWRRAICQSSSRPMVLRSTTA